MKKVFYLLSLCLLLNMTWLSAQTVSTWDGSAVIWTQGSGTQADPYLIENAQNLAWIAEMVNGGVATYAGVWFKLTTDLNMNNIAWVPIGNSSSNLFRGKFDGDNHFIDNISITGNYTYKGLFGIVGEGFRCLNLGVKTTITSSSGQNSGGIVGRINGNNTVIQNCYNTGNITGKKFVGGIVGLVARTTTIQNCYNTGTVSSDSISGGVVGLINGDGANTVIKNCHNTGNITSTSSSFHICSGGLIGLTNGENTTV